MGIIAEMLKVDGINKKTAQKVAVIEDIAQGTNAKDCGNALKKLCVKESDKEVIIKHPGKWVV